MNTKIVDQDKVTRRCIICDSDNYEILFSYTYDFLTKVRDHSPELLAEIGWSEDTTSSIVRCKNCRAKYIRDVIPGFERSKKELSDEEVVNLWNGHNSYKKLFRVEYRMWRLYSTISLAINNLSKDIKLLDYGAGAGVWCNMARALGVKDVFAYDPYSAYNPKYYQSYNFPGIYASRSWGKIQDNAPFDVVICNSTFEHLFDPKEDISRIHDNMTRGGYFYIDNPFFDLDNEIDSLRKAKKIVKKMEISHYHPGHVNLLTPYKFKSFLKSFGFKIINIRGNPLIPSGDLKRLIKEKAKSLLLYAGLYKPTAFILKKT